MAELADTLDEVVRREKSRVVGGLVRVLGSLDAAEDAFADAVVTALARWPSDGTPTNPAAWLTATARNHALDAIRHRRVVDKHAPSAGDSGVAMPAPIEAVSDDELRLIFTCCHPALTLESRVALTLKVVAGFSIAEIARAFLSPEKTIAQRIVRAQRTIEDHALPYEVPGRAELPHRLDAVLAVIYLVFNEGYTTRAGALVRLDLQREAWRLCRVLCDLLPNEPEAFGLFALIAFACARAATRTDEDGELLQLAEQDRARWDRAMIKEGLVALERARKLGGFGHNADRYALQAEIAGCHATAPTWDATDWGRILRCYDELLARAPSPVVALNRAVAVCMHAGPAVALGELADLEPALARYHLFYAMRADFRRRLGSTPDLHAARADYQRALELATNASERRFLQRQLAETADIAM